MDSADTVSLELPLIGSVVEAGFPSGGDDFVEDRLNLNRYLISHPAATFLIRVSGNSMIGAGIFPKDIVVVDRSLDPQDKDIVIAVLDGEFTLKRLRKIEGGLYLCPENPQFPKIRIAADQVEFAIWGVVTSVVRKLKP